MSDVASRSAPCTPSRREAASSCGSPRVYRTPSSRLCDKSRVKSDFRERTARLRALLNEPQSPVRATSEACSTLYEPCVCDDAQLSAMCGDTVAPLEAARAAHQFSLTMASVMEVTEEQLSEHLRDALSAQSDRRCDYSEVGVATLVSCLQTDCYKRGFRLDRQLELRKVLRGASLHHDVECRWPLFLTWTAVSAARLRLMTLRAFLIGEQTAERCDARVRCTYRSIVAGLGGCGSGAEQYDASTPVRGAQASAFINTPCVHVTRANDLTAVERESVQFMIPPVDFGSV